MAYRYRVRDGDGDISIIEFEFNPESGALEMKAESKQLIAIKGITVPNAFSLVESFEHFVETGELGLDEDENTRYMTLLIMLFDEWCDTPRKVQEAESVFDVCVKMAYSVLAIKAMAEHEGEDIDELNFPRIRTDRASFLWDSFVYVHEQGISIDADPERKREVEKYVREETGHNEFELADAMPKSLGCWALPVKMYEDQDYTVTRVPYEVMKDLYDDWKKSHVAGFDGSKLKDELPINITNEINELFNKFNKKRDK